MATWSVVIPVKRLGQAKTRLRGACPGVPHERLVLGLALDTVAACLTCADVTTVVVVTDEPAVREAVGRLGARVVPDVPGAGLNPALRHGAGEAVRHRPGNAVAALAADLPALRPADLAAALRAAERHARAYVPDVQRTGTVLLTARPGVRLDPRFGAGSADAHHESGAVELVEPWPTLRRDVDTAADLAEAAATGLGRHTAAALHRPDEPLG